MRHVFNIGLGFLSSFFFLSLWPNVEYMFARDVEFWTVSKNIFILLLGVMSFLKMRGRTKSFLSFYSGAVLFCIIWLMIFTPHVIIISDEDVGAYGALEWLRVIDWWIYYCLACFAGCLIGVISELKTGRVQCDRLD